MASDSITKPTVVTIGAYGFDADASFTAAYQAERLADFDPARFVADLGPDAHVVCLFCVEGNPAACHRSLVAQRLADDLGLHITHITASHPDEELAPTQSL